LGPRDGWKRRRNDTIAHIVAISYSGERKGAGTVNNRLMWIDLSIKRVYPVPVWWVKRNVTHLYTNYD
jgi:hypothetical protein